MKTKLDDFYEVLLLEVKEGDSDLICKVSPMKVHSNGLIIEDNEQGRLIVCFGVVSGFLVVPEINQVGLGLKYSNTTVLSEVLDSSLLKYLGYNDFKNASRHFSLRTSHQFVNVFIDADASESIESLIRIFPENDDMTY